MRIFTLLSLVAVLAGGTVAPAFSAEQATCHLQPVGDSAGVLQHSQSVAVLYSENTVNSLQYLEQYHSMALNGVKNSGLDSRIRDAFVSSSDPALAIDWLKSSLQKEFASVTVYDNLDAVVQAKPDVVVMLDTYNRLVTQRNSQVEARFIAKFYDADLQYIGKAEGYGGKEMTAVWVRDKAAGEIAALIDQQRELQVNALKQFDASLKTLMTSGETARVAAN
jgi:ABC-type Fe3+-hydroxamate transport system substrate-binding protein